MERLNLEPIGRRIRFIKAAKAFSQTLDEVGGQPSPVLLCRGFRFVDRSCLWQRQMGVKTGSFRRIDGWQVLPLQHACLSTSGDDVAYWRGAQMGRPVLMDRRWDLPYLSRT